MKKKKRRYIVPEPPPAPDWNKQEELWQFQDNDLDWSQPNSLAQVADDCGLTGEDDFNSQDDTSFYPPEKSSRKNSKLFGRKNRRAM